MSQHPEIIAAPFTVWIAPVGTAFPALNALPAISWMRLGKNGARNMADGGIAVSHQQNWVSPPPPAGETASGTVMLESEDLRVRFELLDLTLEQYSLTLGSNAITTVAGTTGVPGTRSLGLSIGPRGGQEFALLARGPSSYVEGLIAQYELARCREVGSPRPESRKGVPAKLAIEFQALPEPAATSEATRFGRLVAQDSGEPAAPYYTFDDGLALPTFDMDT